MNEVLIDYETAKLAKQKGFNEAVQSFIYEDGIHWSPVHLIDDLLYVYKIEKRHESNKSIITLDSSDTLSFYLCPTQSLLQKWLREKHSIDITIYRSFSMKNSYHYCIMVNCKYDEELQQCCIPNRSYEKALEGALLEALKLIK